MFRWRLAAKMVENHFKVSTDPRRRSVRRQGNKPRINESMNKKI